MLTWKEGCHLLSDKLREDSLDLPSFLEAILSAHLPAWKAPPCF